MSADPIVGYLRQSFVKAGLTSAAALRDDEKVKAAARTAYKMLPMPVRATLRVTLGKDNIEGYALKFRDKLVASGEVADIATAAGSGSAQIEDGTPVQQTYMLARSYFNEAGALADPIKDFSPEKAKEMLRLVGLARRQQDKLKELTRLDPKQNPWDTEAESIALMLEGLGYAQTKDLTRAVPKLEESIKLNDTLSASMIVLSDIYQHLGRTDDAISTLKKASKVDPDDVELIKGIAELEAAKEEASREPSFATKAFRWYLTGTWPSAMAFAVVGSLIVGAGEAITGQKENTVTMVLAAPFILPFGFKLIRLVSGIMFKMHR